MTLTTVNPALLDTQAQYTGFKNRIINGQMQIDQRNAGASVSIDNTGVYTLDRWYVQEVADSVISVQQTTTAPTGFNYSTKITVTTADSSLGATQYCAFRQRIEGYNVADLGFGTANAKTITVSFWVRSSVTGVFGACITNANSDRAYPFNYTISVADTWEQKTVTIDGDTSGTWGTTNGTGLQLVFSLGAGSSYSGTANAWATVSFVIAPTGAVALIGTLNATFYITGVQLEKGSTATSFDYRPYGTELALCQRYYFKLTAGGNDGAIGSGYNDGTVTSYNFVKYPVTMRTAPTLSASGLKATGNTSPTLTISSTVVGIDSATVVSSASPSVVSGQGNLLSLINSSTAYFQGTAEL